MKILIRLGEAINNPWGSKFYREMAQDAYNTIIAKDAYIEKLSAVAEYALLALEKQTIAKSDVAFEEDQNCYEAAIIDLNQAVTDLLSE